MSESQRVGSNCKTVEGIYRDSVGMRERTIGWKLAQA